MKNSLTILLSMLFCISIVNVVYAGDIAQAEDVTFYNLEGIVEQVKRAVFCLQTEGNLSNDTDDDDWNSHGTGFLVEGKEGKLIGITCTHIVSPIILGKKTLYAGFDTEKGYSRVVCKILYIDTTYDLTFLTFLKSSDIDSIENLMFAEEDFDTDNSSIVVGRGVIMPGYPLSLGIEDDGNHPVIRSGIIAQYTGKDYFLIDGFASSGNSGSPIASIKHKNYKLVGMVTSYVNDSIVLLSKNGKISAALPYNSGLARVVTMKTIKEIMDSKLK